MYLKKIRTRLNTWRQVGTLESHLVFRLGIFMILSLAGLASAATVAFYATMVAYADQSLESLVNIRQPPSPPLDETDMSTLRKALPPDSFLGIFSVEGQTFFWSEYPFHSVQEDLKERLIEGYQEDELQGNLHHRGYWFRYRIQERYDSQGNHNLWMAGKSLQFLGDALDRMQLAVGLLGLLAVITAIWGGFRIVRHSLIPLDEITKVAGEIIGDPDTRRRVPVPVSQDQIGKMVKAFNTLLDRLQDAKIQAESALESKNLFFAEASHELRTPMTVLQGNLGILKRLIGENTETESVLDDMAEDAQRLKLMTDRLLLFSAAGSVQEAGVHTLDLSLELSRFLRNWERVEGTGRIKAEQPVSLEVRGPSDPLFRILGILLENALQYSPHDKVIRVILRDLGAGGFFLVVADEGPGIPPEERPRIFDPFFRGAQARACRTSGSGLGLSLAKRIAEGARLQIQVHCPEAGGTEFRIEGLWPMEED